MVARRSPLWVPERAEIIFIQYNPQVGKEMPDDHPMRVMSVKPFAERTGLVVGFPVTHAELHADNRSPSPRLGRRARSAMCSFISPSPSIGGSGMHGHIRGERATPNFSGRH
jgi:hypothetical protein